MTRHNDEPTRTGSPDATPRPTASHNRVDAAASTQYDAPMHKSRDQRDYELEVQERAAIFAEAAGEGGGATGDRHEASARREVSRVWLDAATVRR